MGIQCAPVASEGGLSKSLFYPNLIIRPGDVGQSVYSEAPAPVMEERYDSKNFHNYAVAGLYAISIV